MLSKYAKQFQNKKFDKIWWLRQFQPGAKKQVHSHTDTMYVYVIKAPAWLGRAESEVRSPKWNFF